MYLSSLLLFLCAAILISALPTLETRTAYDNRTINCPSAWFGGCCQGTLNVYGSNAGCYNATLAAANVGGSTFGQVNRYECVNQIPTGSDYATYSPFFPLCCKIMILRVDPITTEPMMNCESNAIEPQ